MWTTPVGAVLSRSILLVEKASKNVLQTTKADDFVVIVALNQKCIIMCYICTKLLHTVKSLAQVELSVHNAK